jgi:hypothetical protein
MLIDAIFQSLRLTLFPCDSVPNLGRVNRTKERGKGRGKGDREGKGDKKEKGTGRTGKRGQAWDRHV